MAEATTATQGHPISVRGPSGDPTQPVQDAAAEEESPRTVFVVASPAMGSRVALWDRDPVHPGGEILVAGQDSEPVEVAADAPAVTAAIDAKKLVVLNGSALARRRRQAEAARESREAGRQRELALRREVTISDSPGAVASLQAQIEQLRAQLAAASAPGRAQAGQAASQPDKAPEPDKGSPPDPRIGTGYPDKGAKA